MNSASASPSRIPITLGSEKGLVFKRLTFYYRISMEVIVCFVRKSTNLFPLMAMIKTLFNELNYVLTHIVHCAMYHLETIMRFFFTHLLVVSIPVYSCLP